MLHNKVSNAGLGVPLNMPSSMSLLLQNLSSEKGLLKQVCWCRGKNTQMHAEQRGSSRPWLEMSVQTLVTSRANSLVNGVCRINKETSTCLLLRETSSPLWHVGACPPDDGLARWGSRQRRPPCAWSAGTSSAVLLGPRRRSRHSCKASQDKIKEGLILLHFWIALITRISNKSEKYCKTVGHNTQTWEPHVKG